MRPPFTKSDLRRVLVKLMGVLLVFSATYSVFVALGSWWTTQDALRDLPLQQQKPVEFPLKLVLMTILLPLAVGIYLLQSGSLLHRCLMSVPLNSVVMSEEDNANPEIGLTGAELEAFKRWLHENPGLQKRDLIDQLALFRDDQEPGEG